MSPSDYGTIATGIIAVIASGAAAIRWMVSHYLRELIPNGGSSMADRIGRIEANQTRIHERIDAIYEHLIK